MVVERFGKLHAIHESGYFFAVPVMDRVAYVIDVRERAVDILPQSAITRDNVSVEVSGNLFVRVIDPERAAYGARNPLYAVMMVSKLWDYLSLFCEQEGSVFNIFYILVFCSDFQWLGISIDSTITQISFTNIKYSMPNLPCDLPSVNSN